MVRHISPSPDQPAFFEAPFFMEKPMPGGFSYQENFISPEEEATLLAVFETLPFKQAEHQGYAAQRRIVGYGWHGEAMPDFLVPIRDRAAAFAGIAADTLFSALISEYSPGAPIGWHRDKPTIGHVLGVSLGSTCQFRLRRQNGDGWDRFSVPARARSIYCMSGESRRDWQHSIPAVEALRYSITFRDFRDV